MFCYQIINNDLFLLKYLQLIFSVVPLNRNNKPIGNRIELQPKFPHLRRSSRQAVNLKN